MSGNWPGTFSAPIVADGMWLWYVYHFSITVCLDFSYLNSSPRWNKAPFIEFVAVLVHWMKRMAGSTVLQVRVPVFGFTCHHVRCVWGSVHPWILKMVCHPCSVWYVKGSVAEMLLMSIGLQISFRLNLIFARCFSFLCDGLDYRCSWWRFFPVHPILLHTSFSLHTILPEWSLCWHLSVYWYVSCVVVE